MTNEEAASTIFKAFIKTQLRLNLRSPYIKVDALSTQSSWISFSDKSSILKFKSTYKGRGWILTANAASHIYKSNTYAVLSNSTLAHDFQERNMACRPRVKTCFCPLVLSSSIVPDKTYLTQTFHHLFFTLLKVGPRGRHGESSPSSWQFGHSGKRYLVKPFSRLAPEGVAQERRGLLRVLPPMGVSSVKLLKVKSINIFETQIIWLSLALTNNHTSSTQIQGHLQPFQTSATQEVKSKLK